MATEQTIELSDQSGGHTGNRAVTELAIGGMTCGNCARHVTEAIQGVAGVQSATVSLDAHQASVRWDTGAKPNAPAVIKAVKEAGYEADVAEVRGHEHGERKLAGWQINLWIGVIGTAPLMVGEWVFGLSLERWFQWTSFLIASVVQVFAGARFYRGAWGQLKAGSSNMDTLVALGSTSAFAYSAWAFLSGVGGHVYFMEAAAIITLVSVGHWLEAHVGVRASGALQKLLNLAPPIAHRRNSDGTAKEVPVAELKPADVIVLRPGDRVPTDGEVVEGDSAVDESMLTGESAPVDKTGKSRLYAGTVNLNGMLVMRVTGVGEETALANIIVAVQRAQTSRANIQRLGDRVSSVFVPIVVAVALASALWWGLAPESASHVHGWFRQFLWPAHLPQGPMAAAFIIASAVLIIACPCAMGLATPVAIMAGSNAAAARGILIRDGQALEKAGLITAVLFDKTGTLTIGKPSVVKVWEGAEKVQSPQTEQHEVPTPRCLSTVQSRELAAGLARHSNHPISQAVARLSSHPAEVKDWEEIRGAGILGKLQTSNSKLQGPEGEQLARLGSLRWLEESGVGLEEGRMFTEEWSAQGTTIVGLAVGKSLCALFAVKDTVKTGASAVIERLRRQGLKTYLVTGDNSRSAGSIARQAGILPEHVFAEVRPEQKAELVKKLQQKGERVAFVGDGINDAPALEQADLGIAVSRASDIAREAADIILLNSEIEAVPESLGLARATLRTIKQNLFWAFFYNAIGVPLAALGFMSPVLCAAAMGLSDLVVIGNALRLRRPRPHSY